MFTAKLCAWDKQGKITEVSSWYGFRDLEEAKTFAKKWFQFNHVGFDKKITITEEGSRIPIVKFNNFKTQRK